MENEVLIVENQINGKVSTVWFQVSCHKDREEATQFIVFGKLLKCESSMRNRYLVFMNSHRRFFFSSTSCSVLWCVKCTSPSSGALQWCPQRQRQGLWGFWFFFFFGYTGSISCMAISLLETSGGYSLLAGCMASHCGGFFCCGAPALGTHTSVVLLHRLSIGPSSA